MKSKLSIIISLLLLLFSCAEEGPFNMGNIGGCKVNLTAVTPTAAFITIEIPQNNPNCLINRVDGFWLSDNLPLSYGGGIDYAKYVNSNTDKYVNTGLFKYLKPNTTYYVMLEVFVNFNGTKDFNRDYDHRANYYSGYSFTTPKEGDYSGLGELYCKLIEPEKGYTRVEITLPDNLTFRHGFVKVSETTDMKNAITAEEVRTSNDGNVVIAYFKNMKSGIYYLCVWGTFDYDGHWLFDSTSLNVKNALEIPNTEEQVLP